MKLLIVSFLVLGFTQCCAQQVYTCHTSIAGKATTKIEMQIFLTDTLVTFELDEKPTSYKRIQSNEGIYYTDGDAKSSITMIQKEGKKGGLYYNRILSFNSPALDTKSCYCYKH
jgi:hypothetical protein